MLNRALPRVVNRISRPFVGHTQMRPFSSARNASTFLGVTDRASYFLIIGGGFAAGCLSLYRWFYFEKYDDVKSDKQQTMYFSVGSSLFCGCGALVLWHAFPYITSGYSPWAVHRVLKYCTPHAEFSVGEMFPNRQPHLQELKQTIDYTFKTPQNFVVIYGPKGVGKTELVKNVVQNINNDKEGPLTVFAECSEHAPNVLKNILKGFDRRLPNMVYATMEPVHTFKDLEELLREHLPVNTSFLVVVDGLKSRYNYAAELQEFARDMSEERNDCANVKVLLVCSDHVDILLKLSLGDEARALEFVLPGPTPELYQDFVKSFCSQFEVAEPETEVVEAVAEHLRSFGWDFNMMRTHVLLRSITEEAPRKIILSQVAENVKNMELVDDKLEKAGTLVGHILVQFIKDNLEMDETGHAKPFDVRKLRVAFLDGGLSDELILSKVLKHNLGYKLNKRQIVFHPQLIALTNELVEDVAQ